jgi:DNA-binding transcriptional MerR regulator/methylmalonyl-CoA mutase cobalamin-binding subunit
MSKTADSPTHSIREVSQRTGLSLDVIRVWERRYKAVVPERLETGRRLYSEAQISRLTMLRRATEQGRRIGDAAKADDNELKRYLAKQAAPGSAERVSERAQRAAAREHLQACIHAVRGMEPGKLDDALRRAHIVLPANILLEDVLGALMTWIGDEWSSNGLRIGQEQVASAALRKFLVEHARYNGSRDASRPALLVATPAGQVHEFGALMVAMACVTKGWRVDYAGADVSATEIVDRVRRTNPQLVALSIVHPEADAGTARELRRIRQGLGPNVTMVIGGRAAAGHARTIHEIGAVHCESISQLADAFAELPVSHPVAGLSA